MSAREVVSMTLSFASVDMPLEVCTDGVLRVGKTRVTLDTVIAAFDEGSTPEEIVQQYPSLELADVYHVIGYYLRNPREMTGYLRKREKRASTVRKENEARFDPVGVRQRLLARRPNTRG
jgi:uncharacterized protein (DUF433 family)